MPVATRFSRGMPERTETPRVQMPPEVKLLPDAQKHDLCISLLQEFGVTDIRESSRNFELVHGCLVTPSHVNQDREPTASLNYENLMFHCLGCKASGNILWFIAEVRGVTTEDALRWLVDETGLGNQGMDLGLLMRFIDALYRPKGGHAPIPSFSERMLEPWDLVHPYLTDPREEQGCGIPEGNVRQMRLGYAEDYRIGKDPLTGAWRTSERIVVPHFWKGSLVGWQSRRLDSRDGTPKYLASTDFPKESTLYNYQPRTTKPVVVVEAPLSAVSKVHLDPHIEATFGADVTETQIGLLAKHPKVVWFLDNDSAGWDATDGVTRRWPDGSVRHHKPGAAETLSLSTNVFVVENPYAADVKDLLDEDYLALVDAAVPLSLWRRPTSLLCYRCRGAAHEGPC